MDIEEIIIDGIIEDIVYSNPENGYSVIDINHNNQLVTAVGIMPSCCPGEKLRLRGCWTKHPTFGTQFKANAVERSLPKSSGDMLRYLSSGAVKGIGPSTAMKIIERFGDETFDVLENSPEKLSEIKGISFERAKEMCRHFKEQFVVNLQQHLRFQLAVVKGFLNTHHGIFDDVGRRALNRHIEGNPFCCGTDGTVP